MNVCCSSRASICYWLVVSLAAWAALVSIGMFWHPLHATSAVTCLLAMAIGCFVNAFKNRTYHCVLTGPLFLIAAILLLDARQACCGLGGRSDWDRNRVSSGVALFPEAKRNSQLLIDADTFRVGTRSLSEI